MEAREFYYKRIEEEPTIGSIELMEEYSKHSSETISTSYFKQDRMTIATAAMQGMLANPTISIDTKDGQTENEVIAKASVVLADALLEELNKE